MAKKKLERWTPPAETFSGAKSSTGDSGVTYDYTPLPKADPHTLAGAKRVAEFSRMTLDEALAASGKTRTPGVALPMATQLKPTPRPRIYGMSDQGVKFDGSDAGMTFGVYDPSVTDRGRVGNVLGAGGKGWISQQANALAFAMNPNAPKDAEMMFGTKDADTKLAKKNAEKIAKWMQEESDQLYKRADHYAQEAQEHADAAKDGLGKGGQLLVDAGIAATQMGMDIGLGKLTGTGMASMGTRTFGSASREALESGATREEAGMYGAGSAAVELLTEKIFDTAKLFGGGAGDELAERLVRKLAGGGFGRTVWRTLISAAEEGSEEVISDLLKPLLQSVTYDKSAAKNAFGTAEGRKQLLGETLDDFTVGGILGMMGAAGGIVTGRNAEKNALLAAQDAADAAKKAHEKRTNDLGSNDTKQAVRARLALLGQSEGLIQTADAIVKQASGQRLDDVEIGLLNTPAAAQAYSELMDAFNMNNNDSNVWARKALGDTVLPKVERIDSTLKMGDATPENIRTLQSIQNGEEVSGQELADVMRNRELTRNWMRTMGMETDDNISDQELEKMFRRAVAQQQGKGEEWARSQLTPENQARYDAATTETAKSGILAGATDEAIGTAERLSQAIGRRIVFVSKESNWNGDYDSSTGVMRLNANSENPVAQIIGHELTHSIETAGESYTQLMQLVSRRISKTGDLEAYRNNIRQLYASNGVELDRTQLDHEMLAKYVEENLLTNEESITSLVKSDRTLGQVIKNFLDRILAKLGNTAAKERAFIQRARNLYALALQDAPVTSAQQMEDLYRRFKNKEITEEEYDAAFDRAYNAEDALRAEVQNSFAGPNAKTADMEQLRMAKEMLAEDVDPETIRQQTGWFQGADGKWRFEIDDSSSEERKNTPPDTGDENTVFADDVSTMASQNLNREYVNYGDMAAVQGAINEAVEKVRQKGNIQSIDISSQQNAVDWTNKKAARRHIKNIIKTLFGQNVYFEINGGTLTAYFTKTAANHFAVAANAERAATAQEFQELVKKAEYAFSADHDIHSITGQTTQANVWDYFVGVVHNGNTEIPVLFSVRSIDSDVRAQIYGVNMQTETGSHDSGPMENQSARHSNYGDSTASVEDNLSESEAPVNTNPLPKANSSTLQNSVSEKRNDPNSVVLPQAGEQTNTKEKAAEGIVLPKAGAENVSQEDRLPKKAQTYLKNAKKNVTEKIARALDLPAAAKRNFMEQHLNDATEEYLRTGKISEETRKRIFEQAYAAGRVIVDDYYNEHKHIKDEIRRTGLNIEDVKGDIADLGDFRRQHMGTIRLVKGGMGIDQFYKDVLHNMEPGLFPLKISNRTDQLMRIIDVAESIKKAEYTLDEFYGSMTEEHQAWARNDFEAAMDALTSELRLTKRYAEDENALTPEEPVTAANVQQAYKELKEHRRTYEKAAARNLLTDVDEIAVGRILRGEDTVDGLDSKRYNVKGIRAVVEAKRDYEQTARKIRQFKSQLQKKRWTKADVYIDTVTAWKDKKTGVQYSRETMERNIRDIVANEQDAQRIIDAYFTPVHIHEAAATRMKTELRKRVQGMQLSRKIAPGDTVSEAHAVQLLGEAMDNMQYLEQHKRVANRDGKTYEEWQAAVRALWESSPNLNRQKIEGAVEQFRAIYDELFQQMNEVRIRNGYEPINYRQGYFPHFQPGDSSGLLEQFSRALGISADVTSLPTTINGLTHQFRPGIRWFGNAQERIGFNTTYDAVEGFDKYIEGAADVIHHTDDIQALRALSDQIRYRSSDKGIQEQADRIRKMDNLTDDEKQTLLDQTYQKARTHLGNFVVELEEYTNLLANKRSRADRDMEQRLGRNMYNLAKRFESRVAANMVAINPGSWLTNFIPLTQGWTTTETRYMVQGMWESLKDFKTSDGMLEKSDFLTNRKGSDPLVKMWEQSSKAPTAWQNISAFGGRAGEFLSSPMEHIDQFTAGALVRARYHQNVSRGMSESAAIQEADAWTSGIMADRSKGSMPTVFNQQNPLKKVFTQFQLEVNNELSWLVKDVPDELKELKEKTLGAAALGIFKFLVGTYLYNDLYEALVGRRAALDPLGILNDTVGDLAGYKLPNLIDLATGNDDFETKKKDIYETAGDFGGQIAENLPFIGGVLGGGRVPISSALPSVDNLAKAAGKSGLSGKKRAQLIGKELGNSASYVALPFGGSQLRKIVQGVSAVAKGGSYSMDNDGNKLLQYPVYNDSTGAVVGNTAKAILFGKSSLKSARDWVDNDFKSGLNADETAAYIKLKDEGANQKDAYDLIQAIGNETGKGSNDRKAKLIQNSNLTDGQKQALYSTLVSDSLDEEYSDLKRAGVSWDEMMAVYEAKKEKKDVELALWVDTNYSEKEAAALRKTFKISSEKYDEMRSAGMSPKDAAELTEVISELNALEGKKQVTDLQKYQAIAESDASDEAKAKAIKSVMRADVRPKYEATEKYDVKPVDYVAAYAKVVELKTKYGKSQVNAAIAKEAIDSIPGLTTKQRAALWQVQKKNFNPAQNPYDVTIGQIVYNIQYGLDAGAIVLP